MINHICLSLGRVRSLHEGLGEFAFQLGSELAKNADRLFESHGVVFHFHARKKLHGCFGSKFRYHQASVGHRWFNPTVTRYSVWHVLHQLNTTLPAGSPRTVIATVHDLNFLYLDTPAQIEERLKKTRKVLGRATDIVAISEHSRSDLVRHLDPAQPVSVIYNGVADLSRGRAEPITELIGKYFFFHISRLAPSKNVSALLALAQHWPDQLFVFAGPTSADAEQLAQAIKSNNFQNVLLYTDITTEQKTWLFSNCAAFLFPSIAEGFGLPPLEAMYFGKAVFVSARTALPEVCGQNAFYFERFDPEYMRATVTKGLAAASNPGFSLRISDHAAKYSWTESARKYTDLYLRHIELGRSDSAQN